MNKAVFYLGIGSIAVALVAALVMVPTDPVVLQTTVQTESDDINRITTHEEWIEWYRNADPDELGSHHNEIVRDTWVAQYEFEQEFHPEEGLVVDYLSALSIQQEMLQDTYNYTDEKFTRYHDWLLETFDVPPTLEGVEQAMLDLIGGDKDNMHRIDHVHSHNHRAIMIAEPPFDLWESDPDWWWLQNQLSACQHEKALDCDAFIFAHENSRPLTEGELELMQPDFEEATE